MEKHEITNNKEFMTALLKTTLFDTFETRELLIKTAFTSMIDGKRNKDYFSSEEDNSSSYFLTWSEIRPYAYRLIHDSKLPTYFKIILSTNSEKTAAISHDVSTFFLNIEFQNNKITCTTATSYKGFTMDKSAEKVWDSKIQHFLFKYNFL